MASTSRELLTGADYRGVTHVGVNVADLREAEGYYRDLFGLEVAWRDTDGGELTEAPWAELEAAGASVAVVLLWRDGFRLALSRAKGRAGAGGSQLIGHVGLQVSEQRLAAIRRKALEQGLEVLGQRENELFDFLDRYGVEWELDTRSFADPVALGRQIAARRKAQRAAAGRVSPTGR